MKQHPAELEVEQLRLDLDTMERRLLRISKAAAALDEAERAVKDLAKQLRLAKRQLQRCKAEHALAAAEVYRGLADAVKSKG